jgi:tRNA A-37 threonylcarbamoyl transferase component Bud32
MNISDIEIIKAGDSTWWVRDKAFAAFLHSLPSSFTSFLAQPRNIFIKKGKKKTLREILIDEPGEKAYLIKCYRTAKLPDRIKLLLKGSKARHEFKTAHEIAERQIPVFLPAAAGEKRRYFLIEESYVVTEKVKGCTDLAKYLLREERGTAIQERKHVIDSLGKLTRKIHDQGVLQNDLALNNFLIMENPSAEPRLFFSDFEKVKLLQVIPDNVKLKGLAKLNRVGNKVTLFERLRFLKAYLCSEPADRKRFHDILRTIQKETINALKADGLRKRMTSVYTDRFYRTYRNSTFHGYYRDGYQAEDLLKIIQSWDKGIEGSADREVQYRGTSSLLKVRCYNTLYQRDSGARAWSHAFTLALGTLPVVLPHAFFERTGTGFEFLFLPRVDPGFTLREFLSGSRSDGIAHLSRLLFKAHLFGTFSGTISEETFAFPIVGSKALPHIAQTDSFSFQKEITPDDRERDVSSLALLLSSVFEGKGVEAMVKEYYRKKRASENVK